MLLVLDMCELCNFLKILCNILILKTFIFVQ
jgi:hypothetical protein